MQASGSIMKAGFGVGVAADGKSIDRDVAEPRSRRVDHVRLRIGQDR